MKPTLLLAALLLSPAARAVTLEEAQPMAGLIFKTAAPVEGLPTPTAKPAQPLTALQRHIAFFDKNGDGTITVAETTQGLRELGLSHAEAVATASLIHLLLGPKTSGTWTMDISVANIAAAKHGSDTGIYDKDGEFVPEAFVRMFDQFDVNHSNSLSGKELEAMVTANAQLRPGDTFAAKAQFKLLLRMAADTTELEDGQPVPAMSRDRLRSFYDGSLFYKLAKPVN